MEITLNEMMAKQNFLSKVLLSNGEDSLSKDLKVKIVSMRVKMAKFRNEFEEDNQKVLKELTPDGYTEISQKADKTDDEKKQLEAWNKQINDDYTAYINKRVLEKVKGDFSLTEDEMNEIILVNCSNDVEINGQKINSADFLEILSSLFVA